MPNETGRIESGPNVHENALQRIERLLITRSVLLRIIPVAVALPRGFFTPGGLPFRKCGIRTVFPVEGDQEAGTFSQSRQYFFRSWTMLTSIPGVR